MLIFRYLAKELLITLTALTAILLLIFMSNQLVQYLNRAAAGNLPGMIIMKLMMLELPNLVGLLLPLGFYVALLITYGRLYTDNEMTVLQASGYGPRKLFTHSFILAGVISMIVMAIMIWGSPFIATQRAKLMQTTGLQTLIQTLTPGRFRQISHGNEVFYVESMTHNHSKAKHVFLARQILKDNLPQWEILWANQAFAETDPVTNENYVVLQQGNEYEGVPGRANYQVAQFEQYKTRLPQAKINIAHDIRTASTASLFPLNNPDRHKAAELQWRLSVPIMVLVLTLVAIPLSRVKGRSGKYTRLLPAIILYIIYANFMFVSRDWIIEGTVPIWVGMGWLHFSVALLGCFLTWRNYIKPL